jgi:DNA-binding CsgD family transcriptional regulator/tetratricopeptide (TPR) repeat protein
VSGSLVGRAREMATLQTAFDQVGAGRGGAVLISGEPGIGKTRLAEEFANRARRTGALVLHGRAFDSEGAPAFWPWLQILRELVNQTTGDGAAEASQLAAALDAVDSESQRLVEPHAARFRLFDRIAGLLIERTKGRVLVLVLDDLHWADPPSLALLHFLAGELRRMRLLAIVTYRDVEVHRSHPLMPVLAELSRHLGSTRVSLNGLSSAEVASYIHLVVGRRIPAAAAASVHADTQGNPFFVSEMVRLLAAEGRLDSSGEWQVVLPPTVRATIRRRLARLPVRLISALEIAAVIGREFPVGTVERLCGRDSLVELLGDGVEAGFITPVLPNCGRYRFVHTLVRETLYDELAPTIRRHAHLMVGQTLMNLAGPSGEPYLAEIAHHLLQALPDGDPEQAVKYLLLAARRSYRLLAYEEAVRLYDAARTVAESHLSGDLPRRCEILLGLGEALTRSDRAADARLRLREAAELARGLGSSELLGRIALALGDPWPVMGVVNSELLALCEEAATRAAPALKVRLLARSAIELYWGESYQRRLALSEQALTLATRIDDPAALAHALVARHWALYGPDHLAERLEIASQMLVLGERARDDELVLQGRHWRIVDLLEASSTTEVDFEIAAYAELAARLSHPFARWQLELRRALRALLEGRFTDAERLIDHAYVLGRRQDPRTAAGYHTCQRFQLLRACGRLADLTTEIGRLIEENPTIPGFLALLALVHIDSGHPERARQILARVSANRYAALPRDYNWLGSMALFAEVCGELREISAAEVALSALRPYAGRAALYGRPSFCLGSVARPLGILAATTGRFPESELYFEQALAANGGMGATAYVVHTQADYARMLTSRGGPRDVDRAARMRAQAVTTAAELGMSRLLKGLETGPGSAPAGLTAREVEVLRLVADGRSNQEIAEALSISLNTVLRHVTHILTKTGSTNRTQAARFARSHSLLAQP